MRLEEADAFEQRVRQAAGEAGLSEPAYWASSPRPEEAFSSAAIGSGGRAVAGSKRYTGALFRKGIEEHTPDVLPRGMARNIKRRWSWALVVRNMDTHAFEWSRGQRGEGLTAEQLRRAFDERAIDARSVAIIDARIARRREPEMVGHERGRIDEAPEDLLAELHDELRSGLVRVEDLTKADVQKQALDRYLVVPRDVYDELAAATRPDGRATRMLEIVAKQKPTRVMLGALNVPWLAFQVASNAFLSGLGGIRNPLDVVGAARWWCGLSKAERDAIEPYLGIGYHHALDQPRLGATAENSRLVNAWHAWQKTAVGRALHKGNPLDAMFALDRKQTDFFRRTLFYSQAKRDAYRRMGRSAKGLAKLQPRVTSLLGKPPERLIYELADPKNVELLERHAKTVNDWLGEWTTFTATERALLQRNVVFYGWLRNSLRLAFWTFPVEHPVMTAMLGNLGRLGSQEVKRLLGVPPNYRVPTNMAARMFFGGEKAARAGELRSLPIGRMNPFLNAITSLERPSQAAGIVSPLYQAAIDQLFAESSFTGRDFRIKGRPTPAEAQRPDDYFGSILSLLNPGAYAIPGVSQGHPRNRILQRDLLSLAYPYRLAEDTGLPAVDIPLLGRTAPEQPPFEGPQSDDALVWDPRPMRYKDDETVRSIRRSIERERERAQRGRLPLLARIVPVIPQPDGSRQILERDDEKRVAASGRKSGRSARRRPGARGDGWGAGAGFGSGAGGWGAGADF